MEFRISADCSIHSLNEWMNEWMNCESAEWSSECYYICTQVRYVPASCLMRRVFSYVPALCLLRRVLQGNLIYGQSAWRVSDAITWMNILGTKFLTKIIFDFEIFINLTSLQQRVLFGNLIYFCQSGWKVSDYISWMIIYIGNKILN